MEREFLDILQKQEASETAAYQSAALIRQIIKDDFSNSAEILQVIDACGTELTDFFRMPSCIPFQRKIPLPVRTCDFFHAAKHTLSQIPYLHSHNFYEYIYVLRGNCTQHSETPAQTILLKAHQSCLLSPGVSHIVERCGKEDIILKFAVSESLFREVILPFSSAGMEKDVLIFHHSNAQISMCIYMLLKESRNPCEFGETAIRNYLSLLFIELMRKPPAPYPDIIKKLVRKNFGEDCDITDLTELKGGQFNAVYAMRRTREADRIVLKAGVIPGTPLLTYERDVMPTEVACIRMLKEKTNVPVPEILACDFSKTEIDSNYFFMTAMEGITLSAAARKMDRQNLDRIRAQMAEYMVQMHQIKGSYYGYFTEQKKEQYPTWQAAFRSMIEQLLEDAEEHHTRLPYDRIRRTLHDNASYLDLCQEPALVDFDCHDGNVFVKKEGCEYTVEGILDFERAYWGDPIADFPGAFVFTDDISKEPAFLNSYLKAGSELKTYDESVRKRYLLYRMYLSIIMTAECFRYGWLYGKLQSALARSFLDKCLKGLEK